VCAAENAYKRELNRDNPLGNHGEVATAYAGLLKELFKEGSNSHYAPRHFKQVIGKYGPSFSGYGQQDSQEFLLFLLDGLQEDLNRIKKKPYIEKPDSTDEMVHNQVALMEMADKCWDIYRARNDSVITDLFAGMYKSTVVCPVCDKVSIIFDPFNNLTLQLPIENTWCRTLFFFPLYSSPVRILVDIGKNDSFAELKRFVGKRVDVDPKRMIVAEIYKNKIYKVFSDKKTVGEERITDSDVIGIFELESVPSNYPAPLRKVQKVRSMVNYNQSDEEDLPESSDSPFADNILTTVLCRVPRERQSKFDNMTKEFVGMPTFITVNREEAMDHDAIFKKVLAKVGTCTTTDLLHDVSMDDEMDIEDSDTNAVIVNVGDEDSSSDSKVQATSVQSEDGMVDISMKDVDGATATTDATAGRPAMPRISYPPNMSKNPTMTKKQRFLDSKVHIPGDAASRRLFDLNVHHGKEWFPLGFQGVADNSEVFPLGSNIPEPIVQKPKKTSDAASKLSRRIANGGSATSSDEDELVADNPPPLVQNTGLNSNSSVESDEDDDGLPPVKQIVNTIPSRTGPVESKRQRRLKKKAGLVTYGKRYSNGNIISRSATVSEDADSGIEADSTQSPGPQPLIRLGDVIILDWTREAFNSVFGGESNSDDFRGTATYEGEIPLIPDPALDAKRAQRSHRKRNGISLDDCLDEFGREEILSENDAWYCPRCKEHRRASKKFELWKAPDILVIHLKRFAAHGRLRDKLDVHVNFPVEGLDLSDRVVVKDDGKDPVYDLFAVDNHYGGLGGGHYTAYAKNFFDGEWYDYNGEFR
jgi:ubiquitin carboxyl-terminal hydrolase 4/11/15